MDGADLELFERSLRHATERHTGAALDAALDELGGTTRWPTTRGRPSRCSSSSRAPATPPPRRSATSWPTPSASETPGDRRSCCRPSAGGDPPGTVRRPWTSGCTGWRPAPWPARSRPWSSSAAGDAVVAVTVPTASLDLRPVERHRSRPRPGRGDRRDGIGTDGEPGVGLGDWAAAVALGRLALAHELVGASRTDARAGPRARPGADPVRATDQLVPGRPPPPGRDPRGHRDGRGVLDAAWLDDSPGTAAMAKAIAGREARTAARHCQQVLAGIGFTTEHPLHRYVRRTLVLDGLFGTSATLTRALGTEAITRRQLPVMTPL